MTSERTNATSVQGAFAAMLEDMRTKQDKPIKLRKISISRKKLKSALDSSLSSSSLSNTSTGEFFTLQHHSDIIFESLPLSTHEKASQSASGDHVPTIDSQLTQSLPSSSSSYRENTASMNPTPCLLNRSAPVKSSEELDAGQRVADGRLMSQKLDIGGGMDVDLSQIDLNTGEEGGQASVEVDLRGVGLNTGDEGRQASVVVTSDEEREEDRESDVDSDRSGIVTMTKMLRADTTEGYKRISTDRQNATVKRKHSSTGKCAAPRKIKKIGTSSESDNRGGNYIREKRKRPRQRKKVHKRGSESGPKRGSESGPKRGSESGPKRGDIGCHGEAVEDVNNIGEMQSLKTFGVSPSEKSIGKCKLDEKGNCDSYSGTFYETIKSRKDRRKKHHNTHALVSHMEDSKEAKHFEALKKSSKSGQGIVKHSRCKSDEHSENVFEGQKVDRNVKESEVVQRDTACKRLDSRIKGLSNRKSSMEKSKEIRGSQMYTVNATEDGIKLKIIKRDSQTVKKNSENSSPHFKIRKNHLRCDKSGVSENEQSKESKGLLKKLTEEKRRKSLPRNILEKENAKIRKSLQKKDTIKLLEETAETNSKNLIVKNLKGRNCVSLNDTVLAVKSLRDLGSGSSEVNPGSLAGVIQRRAVVDLGSLFGEEGQLHMGGVWETIVQEK